MFKLIVPWVPMVGHLGKDLRTFQLEQGSGETAAAITPPPLPPAAANTLVQVTEA